MCIRAFVDSGTRQVLICLALIGAFGVAPQAAHAQGGNNSLLSGLYTLNTTGQAQLTDASGDCKASGLVAAALTGYIIFNGQGSFTQGNIGISVGATSCTYPNFGVTGTYDILTSDADSFAGTGTFTMHFQGQGAQCAGTRLISQSFAVNGNKLDGTITIQTFGGGEGSTYAEGPPPGPVACTATIANFLTSGSGSHNSN